MAGNNTSVGRDQVEQTAKKHDETAQQVDQEIQRCGTAVQGHMPENVSQLAQAVHGAYQELQTTVKGKITPKLTQMAQDMRTVSTNQSDSDSEAARTVQGLTAQGSAMGSFLGGN